MRSGDDGDAEAVEHGGHFLHADILTETRTTGTLQGADGGLFGCGMVLQGDLDHLRVHIVHKLIVQNITFFEEYLGDSSLLVGGRDFHHLMISADSVSQTSQII